MFGTSLYVRGTIMALVVFVTLQGCDVFDSPPVEDRDMYVSWRAVAQPKNGWLPLKRALEEVQKRYGHQLGREILSAEKLLQGKWYPSQVKALLKKNKLALSLLQKGMNCPDFGPVTVSSQHTQEVVPLLALRYLTALIGLKVRLLETQGDTSGALKLSLQYLQFCGRLHQLGGVLNWVVGQTVSHRMLIQLSQLLERHSWPMATWKKLGALMKEWETLQSRAFAFAWKSEYTRVANMIDRLRSENRLRESKLSSKGWWSIPFLRSYTFHPNRTKETLCRYYRAFVQVAQISRYRVAQKVVQEHQKVLSEYLKTPEMYLIPTPNVEGKRFLKIVLAHPANVLQVFYESKMELQLLQLWCALKAYREIHRRYPQHLGALVPTYLAKLPIDPFASKDQTYRYSPKVSALWSVFGEVRSPSKIPSELLWKKRL